MRRVADAEKRDARRERRRAWACGWADDGRESEEKGSAARRALERRGSEAAEPAPASGSGIGRGGADWEGEVERKGAERVVTRIACLRRALSGSPPGRKLRSAVNGAGGVRPRDFDFDRGAFGRAWAWGTVDAREADDEAGEVEPEPEPEPA